jgi:hypothetical protein
MALKDRKDALCCRDTTKKAKKLPFDKQKESLNALTTSLATQS